MKFLIVADNSELIQFLIHLINLQNDEYLMFEQTKECIQTINNFQPDWIFVDLSLKERNGFELAETIKHQSPQSSICLLSDFYDERLLNKGKQIGSDVFIAKENLFDFYNIIKSVISK